MKKLITSIAVVLLLSLVAVNAQAITRIGSSYVLSNQDISIFRETTTAERLTLFNLKSSHGLSDLRDRWETGNGGAVLDNAGQSTDTGYIMLRSSTNANGTATLETREHGQYQAGSTGLAGIGIHMNDLPATGAQVAEWGYFGHENGVGYGVNDTGIYIFTKQNEKQTKYYQSDWNKDTLDGSSGSSNPSGYNLDLSDGAIFEIEISYYGEGGLKFRVLVSDTQQSTNEYVTVHNIVGQMPINDPNSHIQAKVENNGTADNLELLVGGRQYSVVGGRYTEMTRPVDEQVFNYELTVAQGEWEPIMAIKRKENFNELNNSVKVELKSVEVLTDNDVAFRTTFGGTTDITNYSLPTNVPDTETAVLTYNNQDFTAGIEGALPIVKGIVNSADKSTSRVSEKETVTFAPGQETVLWVRPLTANATIVSAIVTWDEYR